MSSRYKQNAVSSSKTRFTKAPMGVIEFSTMYSNPTHLTDFNAGDIVPIYCAEVLPHDTFSIDLDFVIRQATVITPTMGQLEVDFYAFFVPNRVVNKSWKNVMGENSSGTWAQETEITLAPLVGASSAYTVQVPLNSVADYYGYPTQLPLRKTLLQQCHDLKFRGYLSIYNNWFRSTAYDNPIPFSTANIFNGFFEPVNTAIGIENVSNATNTIPSGQVSDGSFSEGSVVKEIFGEGFATRNTINFGSSVRRTAWSALNPPLKANKKHDYFTSVLPTPQRGERVGVSIGGEVLLNTRNRSTNASDVFKSGYPLQMRTAGTVLDENKFLYLRATTNSNGILSSDVNGGEPGLATGSGDIMGTTLFGDLNNSSISFSIDDIRMSGAIQQYYEILGRGGGRYIEFVSSFFGLTVDNPFDDIPTLLGHFTRTLDLYQTAQTSGSPSSGESGTPQGTLSAFGYTDKSGSLFTRTFVEHGYIHIMAVVRHRNVYSSLLTRDNFRLSALDFYSYPLANISEQPVYTREINPFIDDLGDVFGYQEAWAEYRMEPSRVSGRQRPQVAGSSLESDSVAYWNYADEVNPALAVANSAWLKSNTSNVVARTTAVTEELMPQFKAQFTFKIKKERPMPTYSVAGMDII